MPGLVVRSPGWAVSTLLHWRPITVLLIGNAVPIGLTSVQNTGDRVAVKGRQEKLTHECVEGCSGTSRYLRGEYVAGWYDLRARQFQHCYRWVEACLFHCLRACDNWAEVEPPMMAGDRPRINICSRSRVCRCICFFL